MSLAIRSRDVPVLLIYNIDPTWTLQEQSEIMSLASDLETALSGAGHPTISIPVRNGNIADSLSRFDPAKHIVFNWCESLPGILHSEQLVAGCLEELGFVFTGAGSEALRLASDKREVKKILDGADIPTPEWRIYELPEPGDWNRFPAIVKPVNEHCSIGITSESVVMTPGELSIRIDFVLKTYDQPALVEDFIDGRELHVSLWGNGHIEMLPPAEMDFSLFTGVQDRLCTYEAKFLPGSRHYEGIRTLLPAPLDPVEYESMGRVCKAAYAAIGCRDYGRIDLRIRDGVFYILDVNPNADISADASLACAADLAGYSYGDLGSRIVRLAAERHPALSGRFA
ncbi:ATP-grasp domain-containing protein [bacterium]|nr:ATP-grasp domain-containing protein [candidate division CSSED10-310 bacterium]